MKKTITVLCAALAACNSAQSKETQGAGSSNSQAALSAQAADAEPVSAMLKEGKPEACAHPAVKARILSDINEGMDNLTPASLNATETSQQDVDEAARTVGEPTLKDTQALDSDQSVGAISCAVHVEFPGREMTVQYALKPSLDDPQDFLMAYGNQGNAKGMKRSLVFSEVLSLIQQRNAAAYAASLKEHPAPEPTVNSAM